MNPTTTTPASTSAFPYTNPYTNPYTTQRKTPSCALSSSSSSRQTPQQHLEHLLKNLVRSTVVPPAQTIEQIFEALQKANEQHEHNNNNNNSPEQPQSCGCWTLDMAESLVTFCIRIFACPENINMTGRNPEGYPATLSFLARVLEDLAVEQQHSILYTIVVKEFDVEVEEDLPAQSNSAAAAAAAAGTNNNKTLLQMSLLQLLHNLTLHFHDDPVIQSPAIVGLSIIWRYLDQITFLTSWKNHHSSLSTYIDSAWWMPAVEEQALVNMALAELLREQDRGDFPKLYMFPSSTELRVAWISILNCLLKHDRTTWLHKLSSQQTKKVLGDLTRFLMERIHQLSDSNNSLSKHNLHQSIASATLLIMMDSKEKLDISNEFHQLVYSTKLIDNVFRSFFNTLGAVSSPSGPRWTFEHKDPATHGWMEEFIYAWSLSKDAGTCKLAFDAVEHHWRPPMEEFLYSLLQQKSHDGSNSNHSQVRNQSRHPTKRRKDLFSRLVLLYSVHHESLRGILLRILSQSSNCDQRSIDFLVQPSQMLVQELHFSATQSPDSSVSVCAASLLRSLWSDRASSTTHDEMSRSLWKVLDPTLTKAFIRKAVSLASTEGDMTYRPLLLCILDTIDLALSSDEALEGVVPLLDTETLETLIHIMCPKSIRIDQASAFMDTSQDTSLGEDNTDTPPVNNLSRFDEASICFEQESEEKPVGLDHSIRLSAATVLTRIGYFVEPSKLRNNSSDQGYNDNGLRLIQTRIRSVVIEFFSTAYYAQHHQDQQSAGWNYLASASMELTRRRFRLLTSMAVPENEEFLSSHLFSKEKDNENFVGNLKKKIEMHNERLQAVAEKERQLENEKNSLKGAIDSQSVRFWREINRVKKSAEEQTKTKISVFDAERKMADHRAHELAKRLAAAENRVKEADISAKASHDAEIQVRQELQSTLKIVQEREQGNEELKRALGQRDSAISQLQDGLGNAEGRLANMEVDNDNLRQILKEREADVTELRSSRETMEQNLDYLFSDLVKLCHMYETKEKTEGELRVETENLSRKVREERSQKEANEQKLLREKEELLAEKEKLERKLLKYKEKLEAERRERKELENKKKNYGPVSYINNLHDSVNTTSVNASRNDKPEKKSSSRRAHKPKSSRGGKENDHESSSRSKANDNFYYSSQKPPSSSSSSCLRVPYR